MNARTPKAAQAQAVGSASMLLLEIEVPRTTAFEAFEDQLDAHLAELEERFRDYVTRNSYARSVGR
ncbi:MAG: hypothetical protein O3C40_33990 [Planctomycetota bacterium]|nr:hypothetical protein [Planctomycetota bacterium]